MPYHTAVRPLTAEEYALLKEDIAKRGIITPIIMDAAGNIVDGFHRDKIAKELGLTSAPVKIVEGTDAELKAMAIALNVARRQLSAEDRRELVAQLREQGHSTRAIADTLGVDQRTVRRDLAGYPTEAFAAVDRIVGKDGKSRPARMPAKESRSDSVKQPEADPKPDNVVLVDFEGPHQPPGKIIVPLEDWGPALLGAYHGLGMQGYTDMGAIAHSVIEAVSQENGKVWSEDYKALERMLAIADSIRDFVLSLASADPDLGTTTQPDAAHLAPGADDCKPLYKTLLNMRFEHVLAALKVWYLDLTDERQADFEAAVMAWDEDARLTRRRARPTDSMLGTDGPRW